MNQDDASEYVSRLDGPERWRAPCERKEMPTPEDSATRGDGNSLRRRVESWHALGHGSEDEGWER